MYKIDFKKYLIYKEKLDSTKYQTYYRNRIDPKK
jgi:hypothetical protein